MVACHRIQYIGEMTTSHAFRRTKMLSIPFHKETGVGRRLPPDAELLRYGLWQRSF
jgi:hypothetical protein